MLTCRSDLISPWRTFSLCMFCRIAILQSCYLWVPAIHARAHTHTETFANHPAQHTHFAATTFAVQSNRRVEYASRHINCARVQKARVSAPHARACVQRISHTLPCACVRACLTNTILLASQLTIRNYLRLEYVYCILHILCICLGDYGDWRGNNGSTGIYRTYC